VVAVGVPPVEAAAAVEAAAGSRDYNVDLIVLDWNLFELSASEISDATIYDHCHDIRWPDRLPKRR